jgi:hypothetical protein
MDPARLRNDKKCTTLLFADKKALAAAIRAAALCCSYDTYDYGTEPITTTALSPFQVTPHGQSKRRDNGTKSKCPSCSCQKQ